VTWEDPI
jgi:dynein heavy chain 2